MKLKPLVVLIVLTTQNGCAHMATRRLHCERQPTERRREVCEAVGRHSVLNWSNPHGFGPNPDFTLDRASYAAIYCELHLGHADSPELKRMARGGFGSERLRYAAEVLHELSDPSVPSPQSMNHPQHDAYRLQGGCPVREK
ncbi:MAG: hypothetical protein RLZZ450_5656 [Pseudomonadota bacterium]|jgi:hypothetical protein